MSEVDFSRILTNPILDIAARLWDIDRYAAFQVCYRSMRFVDDLVDDARTSERPMSDTKRSELANDIGRIVEQLQEGKSTDRRQQQLLEVLNNFQIPVWPWQRLAGAMLYDLHHDGFASFHIFLRYCEGAAIAPAAVFVHLCGIGLSRGEVSLPPFDIRRVARPLAIFSYLTHILRDFHKDQTAGLNYFSDDLLRKHDLTPASLEQIAESGTRPQSFRRLMADYCRMADYYRRRARAVLDFTASVLPPRYRTSLELIYELYLQVFERFDPLDTLYTSGELNPTPAEVQARIELTLARSESWKQH
ncbi:MAG: squalene/phytoene synthase family protein [candidate division Zixibacteria bacterium]|nr:squalene/phytoene synthase family protein [candidate division Zixibacteria bacterium]MDH3936860.1 squalene/phytoene synthase family protein [candidate division Zixibacteria bacterium]MDH4033707.1 squalene/phytoene synthase family protein [candidate division Zixibacteria bacterium]